MIYNSAEIFYKNQKRHHGLNYKKSLRKQSKPWLNESKIDSWRHGRMYAFIDTLINSAPQAKWLTVGDGRYGKEANYLEHRGIDVLATDINDDFLREAVKSKFIKKYKKENAEKLSFKDNTFDYIFCKESYHHFPRPIIALYEMLRVARQGVVLIEPNDVKRRGFSWSRFWSVDLLGTQVNRFETSGNYVYTVSRREMEKVALGIGLPAIAFAGFDDIYSTNTVRIKILLWLLDILFRLGVRDRSLLVSVIFKKRPSSKVIRELRNFGYDVRMMKSNPYLK